MRNVIFVSLGQHLPALQLGWLPNQSNLYPRFVGVRTSCAPSGDLAVINPQMTNDGLADCNLQVVSEWMTLTVEIQWVLNGMKC